MPLEKGIFSKVWSRWFSKLGDSIGEIEEEQGLELFTPSRSADIERRIAELEARLESLPTPKDWGGNIRNLEAMLASEAFKERPAVKPEPRSSYLTIADGTDADTLKCTLTSVWNGAIIAETDNVAKNATTGTYWTLNAGGTRLTIELGNVLDCTAKIQGGTTGYYCLEGVTGGDITIDLRADVTSVDLTALADANTFLLKLDYKTTI